MNRIVTARGVRRCYGSTTAVDGVDFSLDGGAILGLVGPNGAGKTTLLRSLLGLASYEGDIEVLGLDPRSQRAELMREVSFIADTATLPRWMKVSQILDYTAAVHPNFDRTVAEGFLSGTEVRPQTRIAALSKGMTVQLHLALVMAIEARLLVLDEPTLGLDIIYRKRFYDQLLNDYFDADRSIIVSTHQVEEVEHILTDVAFLQSGRLRLRNSMAELQERFVELRVVGDSVARAEQIPSVGSRAILGGRAFIYDGVQAETLATLGEVRSPGLSDLFVAVMEQGARS